MACTGGRAPPSQNKHLPCAGSRWPPFKSMGNCLGSSHARDRIYVMNTEGDDPDDQAAAREVRTLRLTFGLLLATSLGCSIYASLNARGLYADAGGLLVVIYEGKRSFVFGSRAVVEVLRQSPIMLLSSYTSATLFQCGQALTFVMLMLPAMLCSACWWVAPPNKKAWIIFPLAYLLIGFAATSMHAVGEAAIATSYYWILIFVLMFRAGSVPGQVVFLVLCVPAFELHEGTFPLTGLLLVTLAARVHSAVGHRREGVFVSSACILLVAILAAQLHAVIYPLYPDDRAHILQGLTHFEYLYFDGRFNLPLVSGLVALLSVCSLFLVGATQPAERVASSTKLILVAWTCFALAAMVTALTVEQSFSPFSQLQSRYHPPIISAVLGAMMILLRRYRVPQRRWINPATIFVLISLCATQAVADISATWRWNAYVTDLRSRVANGQGLIPWETALRAGNDRTDIDWRIFAIGWVVPYLCVIFAPNGVVNAMVDLPVGATFRPLDPEQPDRLPKLRGINFDPYKGFLSDRQVQPNSFPGR